jgi:hypothetical protein
LKFGFPEHDVRCDELKKKCETNGVPIDLILGARKAKQTVAGIVGYSEAGRAAAGE